MHARPDMSLRGFLFAVVLLLPPGFAAWYALRTALTVPVAQLSGWVLTGLWPAWFDAVEQHGATLDVVTRFVIPGIATAPGEEALFAFTLNPLLYGYGLPFFLALSLAAPGSAGIKLGKVLLGWSLVLLPIQVFGVVMETFKILLFLSAPDFSMSIMGEHTWLRTAVALGAQFASLILPAGAPVVLWLGLNRHYLRTLAPALT